MKKISEFTEGRDNNLNLLRFTAASLVLLSHCWPLTQGTSVNEPAVRLFGLEMGRMAVCVFFAISGFLVGASWERRPNIRTFALARARRVFPGLVVMLLVLVLILGPIFTTASLLEYFTQRKTWSFLLFNATLYELRWGIPGVFKGEALNGSLWTLPVEVRCYLALGLLGSIGVLRLSITYVVVAVVLAVMGYFGQLDINQAPLAFSFFVGVSAWKWREIIPLNGLLALALLVVALLLMHRNLPLSTVLLVLALAYGSLYLAYIPAGSIRIFNNLGDYSYGIYIYAYPIQVTVHQLWPELGVAGMFVISMPIVIILAALSWRFVELPALRGKLLWLNFGKQGKMHNEAKSIEKTCAP